MDETEGVLEQSFECHGPKMAIEMGTTSKTGSVEVPEL